MRRARDLEGAVRGRNFNQGKLTASWKGGVSAPVLGKAAARRGGSPVVPRRGAACRSQWMPAPRPRRRARRRRRARLRLRNSPGSAKGSQKGTVNVVAARPRFCKCPSRRRSFEQRRERHAPRSSSLREVLRQDAKPSSRTSRRTTRFPFDCNALAHKRLAGERWIKSYKSQTDLKISISMTIITHQSSFRIHHFSLLRRFCTMTTASR